MEPLAIIAYKKLLPGSQLLNRLQDLRYRVHATHDLGGLQKLAATEGPMLILLDLDFEGLDTCAVVASLKDDAQTKHIPIIAFADDDHESLMDAARKSGATMVAGTSGLTAHLPQLLDQALAS